MKANCITEIIEFKKLVNFTDEEIVEVVNTLEHNFHLKQEGFIDTELSKGSEEKQWFMIHHYEKMEHLEKVGKKIPNDPDIAKFQKYVESGSVKISFLKQIKIWSGTKDFCCK
ncbi:MAG: hypothetical protein PF517_01565 [Salinivirgaceae bacterium]|jgi:hypothetical protein|nr:hypothetical protein [Salinivirgaceae bacterium]